MKRFSNILMIADSAMDDSIALKRAIDLAFSNQASLTLIDIVDRVATDWQITGGAVSPEQTQDIMVAEAHDKLEKLVGVAAKRGVEVTANTLIGKSFLEIIRQVLRHEHDLVIKCADPSTSLRDAILSSTDMHLLRKCPCPVWIIKPSDHAHHRRILAAVDRDPEDARRSGLNRPILELATSLALAESSELHIVHAWGLFAEILYRSPRSNLTEVEVDAMVEKEENARRQWLEQLLDEHGVALGKERMDHLSPRLHLIKGPARQVIPIKVEELDADLIVLGTVARTGIPGLFMGNTAESILNQIDCSVLAIKPPGFVSPVSL